MRVLIFDTNALVQDFRLGGHAFTILLTNLPVVTDLVALSKIVLDETKHKYAVAINKASSDAHKISNEFRRLTSIGLSMPAPEGLEQLVSGYEEYVVERFGDLARVLPYPNVSHAAVAARAMQSRKPFKESGDGYRDTVIWESILEVLQWQEQPHVTFITNNKSDFWTGDRLADDLLLDLESRGIAPERLSLFLTVKELNDREILPQLERFSELAEQIDQYKIPGVDFDVWLQNALFGVLDPKEVGRVIAGIQPGECLIELSEIYEVKEVRVEHGYPLANSEHYLILTANAGVGINVCADWQQYGESAAICALFDEDGIGVPAPYACVYTGKLVLIKFSLIVHSYDPWIWSIEIIRIGPAVNESDRSGK